MELLLFLECVCDPGDVGSAAQDLGSNGGHNMNSEFKPRIHNIACRILTREKSSNCCQVLASMYS